MSPVRAQRRDFFRYSRHLPRRRPRRRLLSTRVPHRDSQRRWMSSLSPSSATSTASTRRHLRCQADRRARPRWCSQSTGRGTRRSATEFRQWRAMIEAANFPPWWKFLAPKETGQDAAPVKRCPVPSRIRRWRRGEVHWLSRRRRPRTGSCSGARRSTGCASRATSGSNASRRPGAIRRSSSP